MGDLLLELGRGRVCDEVKIQEGASRIETPSFSYMYLLLNAY